MSLFRTKSVAALKAQAGESTGLRRELTATNLVSLGIGSVIGAGIFVLTGQAAAQYSGPAIALAFVISGVASLLAGLCYAEFASMIPIAGSAYTYTYATLGELMAWIIGWDLMLEYLFSAAAVAVGWSANAQGILQEFGINLPSRLAQAPFALEHNHLVVTGAWINLPAVFISLALTVILVIGIKESATFNNMMVFIKVGVLVVLVGYGAWYLLHHPGLATKNWTPFLPENTGSAIRFRDENGAFCLFGDVWNFMVSGKFGEFGWSGLVKGAAVIFFAYIGFDSVSCAAQEAKNPQRDMPIGLLVCLAICVGLFVAVSLVLTGMIPYSKLNVDAPFIFALQQTGAPALLRYGVEVAALAGLTSVILISMLGQPRIFYSMAQDGLLPISFAKVHPKFGTPYITTILTGVVCALTAGVLPLDLLGELISIGTLLAFAVVCLGILVLRRTHPDMPRPFRTPWVPFVPIAGAVVCLFQTAFLPLDTWVRLLIWMSVGFFIYFNYSIWNSRQRSVPSGSTSQYSTIEIILIYFLSSKGRIGRLEFLFATLCSLALSVTILVVPAARGSALGITTLVLVNVINAVFSAKRLHDLGVSGWVAYLTLIPGFSLVTSLALSLLRGDEGPNRYGPQNAWASNTVWFATPEHDTFRDSL